MSKRWLAGGLALLAAGCVKPPSKSELVTVNGVTIINSDLAEKKVRAAESKTRSRMTTAPLEGDDQDLPLPQHDGLKIEVLAPGKGAMAKNGREIEVHYKGTFTNGQVFEESEHTFKLGKAEVIKGWDLGLVGMRAGEKRRLTIAPALGYGAIQRGKIPPNSTLIFEVELHGVIQTN